MSRIILITISSLMLLGAFSGCFNTSNERSASDREIMYATVMAIHDSAMEQMGALYELELKLTVHAGMVDSTGIQLSSASKKTKLIIQDLQNAQDGMMDWMAQFQKPIDEVPDNEAIIYYQEQLALVKVVAADINSSRADAEAYLESIKKNK